MFFTRFGQLAMPVLAALSMASAASLSRRAEGDTFSLFAYGTSSDSSIGGYPLLAANGLAYISSSANVTVGNATAVSVSFVDSGTTWVASSNNTSGSQAFSNATFYVPGPSSSSSDVGFLASSSTASDDIITTGFSFYGHVVILEASSGAWETLFYALPTDTDGLWSVVWNATDDSTAIPLTIKDTQPPNVDVSRRR